MYGLDSQAGKPATPEDNRLKTLLGVVRGAAVEFYQILVQPLDLAA